MLSQGSTPTPAASGTVPVQGDRDEAMHEDMATTTQCGASVIKAHPHSLNSYAFKAQSPTTSERQSIKPIGARGKVSKTGMSQKRHRRAHNEGIETMKRLLGEQNSKMAPWIVIRLANEEIHRARQEVLRLRHEVQLLRGSTVPLEPMISDARWRSIRNDAVRTKLMEERRRNSQRVLDENGTLAPNLPDTEPNPGKFTCGWCKKAFGSAFGRMRHARYCKWSPGHAIERRADEEENDKPVASVSLQSESQQ